MKRPQTKFRIDKMSDSKVIRSKKSKRIVTSKFSCSQVFFLLPFIDILLNLQQQTLMLLQDDF